MKIKQINHGIACRIGDNVYINKRIFNEYPTLYYALIEHEMNHSSGYTKQDVFMDVGIKELKGLKKDYYSFILNNPSSWTEFLPFGIYEKKLIWNPTMLVVYSICLISFLFVGGILG